MDLDAISKYIDVSNVKDLNKLYLITKKYTNTTYYYGCLGPHRSDRYSKSSSWKNAKNAILYANRAEAQQKCDSLNSNRTRIKFKVEEASKHFVSNFTIDYNHYSNLRVRLLNKPVSLQDYKNGTIKVNTTVSKEMVQECLKYLGGQVEGERRQELVAAQEIPIKVKDLETKLLNDIRANQERTDNLIKAINLLKDGTIEKVTEKLKTSSDGKFEVLYGKGG